MKKIFVASLCLIHFTCYKTDVIQHGTANLDPRQWASGGQINSLSQQYNVFCGGVKTCKFLYKYDDSMWADTDNYYSDFSDIKFKRGGPVFISFFNINNDVSYCKGWKGDENVYDGIKWNITYYFFYLFQNLNFILKILTFYIFFCCQCFLRFNNLLKKGFTLK